MTDVLLLEDAPGGVRVLRLNRPGAMNALDAELTAAMRDALADAARDDGVRAIVVTGGGRAFCAGADLVSFLSGATADPASVARQVGEGMAARFNPLMQAMMDFPKPVIVAINGMAAGGGAALALCGDVVLAGRSAAMKFVQVPQLGLIADLGANWLLPRIAGRGTAMAAILLGETLSAERMMQLGLCWDVLEDDALLPRAIAVAARLGDAPPETVVVTRRLVAASLTTDFGAMLDLERLHQEHLSGDPRLTTIVDEFLASRRGPKASHGA